MINNVSFSDYINDCIRILLIINAFKVKKSFKLTDYKIKLYDYYLKFPKTMFKDIELTNEIKNNLDEYYAFFHWQPDAIRYRRSINLLIAKGLISKCFENNSLYYEISEKGISFLDKLKSPYKKQLETLMIMVLKTVSKLSDTKIEEEIRKKANVYARVIEEV